MLVSSEFVLLHPPKTGGSFVTEAVQDFYADQNGHGLKSYLKHGAVDDIPLEHRSKPLVVTVRNPFDFYASHYQFGYWIDRNEEMLSGWWDTCQMRGRFVNYPYLTFNEFVQGTHGYRYRFESPGVEEIIDGLGLGPLTLTMLRFSVPEYPALLRRLAVDRDIDPLKHAVARVRFLHTESLNLDTFHWLLDLGVSREVAGAVLLKHKVQPLNTPNGIILQHGHGQPRDRHWSSYFDSQTQTAVIRREWLFFELFPEYLGMAMPDMKTS